MHIEEDYSKHKRLASVVRKRTLDILYQTGSPHIGSSFSIVEILVALYFKQLNHSPGTPLDPYRDRFILSKGHSCPSLYAVLAEKGFIKEEDLAGFAINGGILEQHPNRDIDKGIEVSTGSLGHGLSIGAGIALGAKKDQQRTKTYVLLGDGELNEGATWEAAMFAAHHRLDNLIAIIDYNKMHALGSIPESINLEPLGKKWASFSWHVIEVNGHDFKDLFNAFNSIHSISNCPTVIIAHTIKGKGVSFMENSLLWHYRTPNDEEYASATRELSL